MRIRIPHVLLAVAVVAGAVVVVPAVAQYTQGTRIVSSAKATPDKAGTADAPRGTAITATARLIVPADVEAPIVTGIQVLVGRGLTWNGGKYVACAKSVLDRHGPKGCPSESIMGSATATGMADTVPARLGVVFVNGGAGKAYAYATLNNPARVRETLVVHETVMPRSSPWDHRETVSIPRTLQIVGGVPLQLTRIKLAIGGKPYARGYIASTSCPHGGWKYQVMTHYLYNSLGTTDDDAYNGSIVCRK